jgi:hypothetical protein
MHGPALYQRGVSEIGLFELLQLCPVVTFDSGGFLNKYGPTKRRKPGAIGHRIVPGYLKAWHGREHNKVPWLDCWGVWREMKSALTLKPERRKIRLVRFGRIYYPRIVNVAGCFDLCPSIVIESPLDGGGGHAQPMYLSNCCDTCAIQCEPVMGACNGVHSEEAESRNRNCRQPLCNPSLMEQQQDDNRKRHQPEEIPVVDEGIQGSW